MLKKENELVFREMVEVYQPKKTDWMTIELNRKNHLSCMRINQKARSFFGWNESKNIERTNLALVSDDGIKMLEAIKSYYPQLYEEYMFMFQIINDFNCPPTFEIMQIMENMKERLEAVLEIKPERTFMKRYKI